MEQTYLGIYNNWGIEEIFERRGAYLRGYNMQ